MKKEVTINDIIDSLYDAEIDVLYTEPLEEIMFYLGYVDEDPMKLRLGTKEEYEELERIESTPLDSNQISELMYLLLYEKRNDFYVGMLKPIVNKYLEIAKEMKKDTVKKTNTKCKKPVCEDLEEFSQMIEVIGSASKALKANNMHDESREMIERVALSFDYDEAFKIMEEYVEIFIEQENEDEFE